MSVEKTPTHTERATLMLARTRALGDLQQACAPAHRAMLEEAVADLDRRLKALETVTVETGPNPVYTILWMHGLGADGHDFEPLVPELLDGSMPSLRFASYGPSACSVTNPE